MKLFKQSDRLLTLQEITNWLRELRGTPYNPSSKFDVTTVFRVKYNNIDTYYFAGVNIENSELVLTSHGEEGCIAAMATAFGKNAEIVEGWVMGAPKGLSQGSQHFLANNKVTCCGKCRQLIAGFADPSVVIHSISLNGDHEQTTVAEFLPKAFSFRQFAPEQLKPSRQKGITLSETEIQRKLIRYGKALSSDEIFQWLKQLESVDYASQNEQAVVIELPYNCYAAGVKIEEAAYLSINPIQSAIANATIAFGEVEVQEVWVLSRTSNEEQVVTRPHSLSLSSIQVLAQFCAHHNILINIFDSNGKTCSHLFFQSASLIPTFKRPNDTLPMNKEMTESLIDSLEDNTYEVDPSLVRENKALILSKMNTRPSNVPTGNLISFEEDDKLGDPNNLKSTLKN